MDPCGAVTSDGDTGSPFEASWTTRFAYLFHGMEMEAAQRHNGHDGLVIDQAQLHGFIERIRARETSASS
jgi:hypothetical protein